MLCLSGRVEIQVGSTTLSPEDGFLSVILTADSTSTSMDLLDGFLTVEQSGSLPSDPISIPVKAPKRLSSVPLPPGPSIEMPLRNVCGGHSQFCLNLGIQGVPFSSYYESRVRTLTSQQKNNVRLLIETEIEAQTNVRRAGSLILTGSIVRGTG